MRILVLVFGPSAPNHLWLIGSCILVGLASGSAMWHAHRLLDWITLPLCR
jgi:hypothetical protein